jgi:general secretion pathway protein N
LSFSASGKFSKLLLVLGLLIYLLYLIAARTPATWAAYMIQQALPNASLTSVKGTLWRGEAGSVQVDMGPSTLPLGKLEWTLNPWSLITLSPCLNFETELPGQRLKGEYCAAIGGTSEINGLNIDAPVSAIQGLLPMDASGSVSLSVRHARFDNTANIEAFDGKFSTQNARVNVEGSWYTLGAIAAQVEADGEGGLAAKIFDLQSPYVLDLAGQWRSPKAPWKFSGTVAPQASAPAIVKEVLMALGEEVEDGVYKVQWPL